MTNNLRHPNPSLLNKPEVKSSQNDKEGMCNVTLTNMKIQKLKIVPNTALDNQRVLNFMRNPD